MQTQLETEQNESRLALLNPSKRQKLPVELQEWLIEQIGILAAAFGEPVTSARLRIYAEDLVADLSRPQLEVALKRARRECRFFPKIAELRELAGADRAEQQDAEVRKAWDLLMPFVRKYVSNDVHGNYGPEHGWYSTPPRLSDRILDTVRRSGGWKIYACMTDEDFPFVQKRFFEEYQAWTAVERVDPSKLLTEMPMLHLVAKSMDIPKRELQPAPMARKIEVKRLPELPTPEQMRDQAAVQKQALVDWESRRQRKRSEGGA